MKIALKRGRFFLGANEHEEGFEDTKGTFKNL
jgi:hypothetical protein